MSGPGRAPELTPGREDASALVAPAAAATIATAPTANRTRDLRTTPPAPHGSPPHPAPPPTSAHLPLRLMARPPPEPCRARYPCPRDRAPAALPGSISRISCPGGCLRDVEGNHRGARRAREGARTDPRCGRSNGERI